MFYCIGDVNENNLQYIIFVGNEIYNEIYPTMS